MQFSPLSSYLTQIQIVSFRDANIQFDIVYRLVQHFAQTVKLYSHMLRWWPSPSGITTDRKILASKSVYLVTNTSLYFASPLNAQPLMAYLPHTLTWEAGHQRLFSRGDAKYSDVCLTRLTIYDTSVLRSVVLSVVMLVMAATAACGNIA